MRRSRAGAKERGKRGRGKEERCGRKWRLREEGKEGWWERGRQGDYAYSRTRSM